MKKKFDVYRPEKSESKTEVFQYPVGANGLYGFSVNSWLKIPENEPRTIDLRNKRV